MGVAHMAWEHRGKRPYYYRKKREGTRVVSEYIGTGPTAHLLAEQDDQERERYLFAQRQLRQQKSDMNEVDAKLESLAELVDSLMRAKLLISGYHPHKGQWRRRRYV